MSDQVINSQTFDLAHTFKGRNGQPIRQPRERSSDDFEDLTLRSLLLVLADVQLEYDAQLSAKQKYRLHGLALIAANDTNTQVSLTEEDIAFLIERANSVFPVAVFGPFVDLLDADHFD